MTYQPHQSEDATLKTLSAEWRAEGLADPHGTRYDCDRAALTMGNLTDDELANGVFLHGDGTHGRAPIQEVIAGRAFWPIAWLTAAKDRIRWLSRALERERAKAARLRAVADEYDDWIRFHDGGHGDFHDFMRARNRVTSSTDSSSSSTEGGNDGI